MSSNNYTPETDPEYNIRADLWPSMTVSQLSRQQELVIGKVSLLHAMMSGGGSVSIQNIYGALQTALKDLNGLIDRRTLEK